MLRVLTGICAVTLLCVATFLLCEGLYAVAQWSEFKGSLTYKIYHRLNVRVVGNADGQKIRNARRNVGPRFTWLLGRDDIEPLVPRLKRAGIALGNSPYHELATDRAAINKKNNGCLMQKPNIDKTMTYLRTNLFNALDPINVFYDSQTSLDPKIRQIIENYGLRLVKLTTNEYGERTTIPAVRSHRKVIVVGDSVANGAGIDDSETISSQLQALDPKRQYINLGIEGAKPADIICALNRAISRYQGQIEELIYVYCENDFIPHRPYGKPNEVVAWLRDFVKKQAITKVTVVYAPYVYNVVPQFTRIPGYKSENWLTRAAERGDLARLVRLAGFKYIDIGDVAMAEVDRAKTQFAALSIFSDHVHLSPYGTTRLVERLWQD